MEFSFVSFQLLVWVSNWLHAIENDIPIPVFNGTTGTNVESSACVQWNSRFCEVPPVFNGTTGSVVKFHLRSMEQQVECWKSSWKSMEHLLNVSPKLSSALVTYLINLLIKWPADSVTLYMLPRFNFSFHLTPPFITIWNWKKKLPDIFISLNEFIMKIKSDMDKKCPFNSLKYITMT